MYACVVNGWQLNNLQSPCLLLSGKATTCIFPVCPMALLQGPEKGSWCFETWYSHLPDNQNVVGKNGCYRRIPIQCLLTCGSRKWVVSRAPCDNRALEPQIHLVVPSSWERREMAVGNGAFWKGDGTSLPTGSPTAHLYWQTGLINRTCAS